MEALQTNSLLTTEDTLAKGLLANVRYPWEALPLIGQYIIQLISTIDRSDFNEVADRVFVHKSVQLARSACLIGPAIIDADTEIRHNAFIRGNALIGKHCVVGNSSEIKNSVLIARCQVPHYNYVGDAILGVGAHLGAGSIVSNLKADKSNIVVRLGDERLETGLRKFGAIVGDGADIGCNSVLAPGSVIGKGTRVYPLSLVRGYVPSHSIYKHQGEVVDIHD